MPESEDAAALEVMAETVERLIALDAQRVATIERLSSLDSARVGTIEQLQALDAERVEAIKQLYSRDSERVATIERLIALDMDRVSKIEELAGRIDGFTRSTIDNMLIHGRNMAFLEEPRFAAAWNLSREANAEGWPGGVPDVRWRAQIALWAARHALRLDGDFVECGVHTGLFSLVICHALEFASLPRSFYLFDTYDGIPLDRLTGDELERSRRSNQDFYHDVYAVAVRNFAPFPNACLVRGVLPGSLAQAPIKRIAYLSIDLNNAVAEQETVEQLWDLVVPGAVILIDDYLWQGHEAQFRMWNEFAAARNVPIAPLPTGQGLLVKP